MSRATSAGDGRCGLAARLASTRCASIASCARRCRWSERPRSRWRTPAGVCEAPTTASRGAAPRDGASSPLPGSGAGAGSVVRGTARSHRPSRGSASGQSRRAGIGSACDGISALTDIGTTSFSTSVYFCLPLFAYDNSQRCRSAVVHRPAFAGWQLGSSQGERPTASATRATWLPAPATHAFSASTTASTRTTRAAVVGAGLRGSPAIATLSARGPVRTVAVQPALSASAAYRRAARPNPCADCDASTTPNASAQVAGGSRCAAPVSDRAPSSRHARSTTAPPPGGRAARGSPGPASATTACADPLEGPSQVSTAPCPASHRASLARNALRGARGSCEPRRAACRR
jgi:hypothetical protein